MKNSFKSMALLLTVLSLVVACSDNKKKAQPRAKTSNNNGPSLTGNQNPTNSSELEARYEELSQNFKEANEKLKTQIQANEELQAKLKAASARLQQQAEQSQQITKKIQANDAKLAEQSKSNTELTEQLAAAKEMLTAQSKTSDEVTAALKETAKDSNQLLLETSKLMKELDKHAVEVRKQHNAMKEQLADYRSTEDFKNDMIVLDILVQDALTVIGKIETQTSAKNLRFITDDENKALIAEATKSLSALRELFQSQYDNIETLVTLMNENDELKIKLSETDIQVDCEGDHIQEGESSIVAEEEQPKGGQISGLIRSTVDGKGLANITLGFKRNIDDSGYFSIEKTDENGAYTTKTLLAGTYFMDILTEDTHVGNRNTEVKIRNGQNDTLNVHLVGPLEEDELRITVKWADESDLDSVLKIPDVEVPLQYKHAYRDYHGAHLNKDHYGPAGTEIITIHDLKSGEYVFYVNRGESNGDLGKSEVEVIVLHGDGRLMVFDIPPREEGSTYDTYEVFRIKNKEVKQTGDYVDYEIPTEADPEPSSEDS